VDISLPDIPAKRYFTIGEVSDLCGVKAYVLRYWEQEFTQLKPMKRRGNRRYYQHHEVVLIRRIRELLYEQGFTISGARNRLIDALAEGVAADDAQAFSDDASVPGDADAEADADAAANAAAAVAGARPTSVASAKRGAGVSKLGAAAAAGAGAGGAAVSAAASAAPNVTSSTSSKVWAMAAHQPLATSGAALSTAQVRDELMSIRAIVTL
jgi:DNA-binding transcriptional MerR regulator